MSKLPKCAVPVLTTLLVANSAGRAIEIPVFSEATIQGGASANLDIDEAAAGYVQVKYNANLDLSRKAYFQFDLTGQAPPVDEPATFTVTFTVSNKQRVQLWALNQDYPSFNSGISWNTAQANDPASNELLTHGLYRAYSIGVPAFIPVSGTSYTFAIPRLGDVLISNHVTLVLTGVADSANNAGGLRLQRGAAVLGFGSTHYDIYLAAGQSNMDGRGYANELVGDLADWKQLQGNVRIYYANPANLDPVNPTYRTGWQVLGPGFSVPPGFTGSLPSARFGPELGFARAVASANTNRAVAIIKVSRGSTSLSSDWKPASGYMYATLTNIVRLALQELSTTGASYTLRGMVWHQGESDALSSTGTYEARLTEFIATVRRDLGITNLPFVVGELATNRSLTVRQAQMNVSETIPYVGFASSSNLVTLAPDDPHFNSPGAIIMGERMAAALECPPLRFSRVNYAPSGLQLTGSGLACSFCRLLATTNLTLPLPQWERVATNVFDAAGLATFSCAMRPAATATFYILSTE